MINTGCIRDLLDGKRHPFNKSNAVEAVEAPRRDVLPILSGRHISLGGDPRC